MKRLLLLCLLLFPLNLSAAHLMVVPSVVRSGEVAWVRWEGPDLANAALRFQETLVPLTRHAGRWEALFGVDVETEPGTYPLHVYASTAQGHSYNLRVDLTVQGVKRPVEHLTLPPGMVTPKAPETLERIAQEHALLKGIWEVWSGPLRAETFLRPVAHPVSSVFGKHRVLNGVKKSRHSGTDFRSPSGTPVLSPAAGEVALVADLLYTGNTEIGHGHGRRRAGPCREHRPFHGPPPALDGQAQRCTRRPAGGRGDVRARNTLTRIFSRCDNSKLSLQT